MQTPSFDFVMIFVSDMEASTRYFTDVLGFQLVEEGSDDNFHQLRGNGGIEFGLMKPYGERGKPGDIEIYVKTDDIQTMREAVLGKGVGAGPIMNRPFGQIFPLQAPDGLTVIAMGAPVEELQPTDDRF